eukprot:9283482-Pyramimonas_sp.AAC.1
MAAMQRSLSSSWAGRLLSPTPGRTTRAASCRSPTTALRTLLKSRLSSRRRQQHVSGGKPADDLKAKDFKAGLMFGVCR